MRVIKIAVIAVLFLVCTGLGYALYRSIFSLYEEQEYVKETESMIKEKLTFIRELQKAYFSEHKEYAKSFEQLENFLSEGNLYMTSRKEEILDVKNAQGQDSIKVVVDTVKVIPVIDTLYKPKDYPTLDISDLSTIPNMKEKTFQIKADTTFKGAHVFEVGYFIPDSVKKKVNQGPQVRELKIGSMKEAKLNGNWE